MLPVIVFVGLDGSVLGGQGPSSFCFEIALEIGEFKGFIGGVARAGLRFDVSMMTVPPEHDVKLRRRHLKSRPRGGKRGFTAVCEPGCVMLECAFPVPR